MENSTTNQSYAILEKDGEIASYSGKVHELQSLNELEALRQQEKDSEIVFVNPFNSIRERGFEAQGEEPILALVAQSEDIVRITRDELLALLKEVGIELEALDSSGKTIVPSINDDDFAQSVANLKTTEIDKGNASQVILSRVFQGKFKDMSPEIPKEIFRRLLQSTGQYMTFLFANQESEKAEDHQYFVGASPERHLEIYNEYAIMNPIAGTMKKGERAQFEEQLHEFLQDGKEVHELFQVLDEEMKMMAAICPKGGKIEGPFLRETGGVIHTEYLLTGIREEGLESLNALRQTLHAPTLVGGPLESAARSIATHEESSRRYYGGEIGVLKSTGDMDTSIMIRSAEISGSGDVRIQAGAGIVRDSNPEKETLETSAKASGMLAAIEGKSVPTEMLTAEVQEKVNSLLSQRNEHLSSFYFENQGDLKPIESLRGKKVSIVNNEDNFAHLLGHMAGHMGCEVQVVDTFAYDPDQDDADIVILGPGPGDVNDTENMRMQKLQEITKNLRSEKRPVLGICLGHQVLCQHAGMDIVQQDEPSQGIQTSISIFGKDECVGFYNSFSATAESLPPEASCSVQTDEKGQVITLAGEGMMGTQFHPESVMSENGYVLLAEMLSQLTEKEEQCFDDTLLTHSQTSQPFRP